MTKPPFERIHNINRVFNRVFSVPLFVLAWLVVLLLLVLPYSGRIALAAFINLFFNRPLVYLNYLARWIVRPLSWLSMTIFYLVFLGAYSVAARSFGLGRRFRAARGVWVDADKATTRETGSYQS